METLFHIFFVACLIWGGLSLLDAFMYDLQGVGVMRTVWTMIVVGIWLYGIIVCGEAVVALVRSII